jgi:signal transduction histidine kinase
MPGAGPAMRRARRVARRTGRGLIQVFTAPDPAPARTRRPPGRRRAIRAGLVLATVLSATISLFGFTNLSRLSTSWWTAKIAAVHGQRTVAISQSPVFLARVPTLVRPGVMALGGPALWSVLTVILALAVVAPLPLAARYPLLGWRIAWAGLVLVPLIGAWWSVPGPWDPVQVPLLLVVFCVAGVRHPRPVLWWMWALSLVPWWLYVGHGLRGLAIGAIGTLAFTATAVAVDAVGTRRRLVADQADQAELEQARRAVRQERARIARELHDVVAHHLSLMAVRAETAPYRLAELPAPVREEFGSLSAAAREALADMRRLLGVLRDDGPAERAPQPQLADLPVLIDAARQAGMPVELSVLSGPAPLTPGPVPSAVGVCAYRIVQESLSNASRHAQGAPVTVSLDHRAEGVLLRVANGPGPMGSPMGSTARGAAGEGSRRTGHGLTGMRERVALLGGSLSAEPSPDGGFVVSARLPVSAAP